MKNINSIQQLLGETDIYLADQIMNGRYAFTDKILDAGCGNGRNLHWFLQNNFNCRGIDISEEVISRIQNKYTNVPAEHFTVSSVEKTTFPKNHFNHILSIAVIHFAKNTDQFNRMLTEMLRIVKPGGSLFIRMTSDIGIENKVELIADGVYLIPDGTKRFLLTKSLLTYCVQQHNLSYLEPLKTVNVNDIRCMSTLVLQKN